MATTKVALTLPSEIKDAAMAQARADGTTLSAVVSGLLQGYGSHTHVWSCAGCGSTLDTQAGQDRTHQLEAQHAAAMDEIHRLREAVTGLQARLTQAREWREQFRAHLATVLPPLAELARQPSTPVALLPYAAASKEGLDALSGFALGCPFSQVRPATPATVPPTVPPTEPAPGSVIAPQEPAQGRWAITSPPLTQPGRQDEDAPPSHGHHEAGDYSEPEGD